MRAQNSLTCRPMHVGVIGCGEVGGAYARALAGKAELSLCDIVDEGRPGMLARELGLHLNAAPGAWLESCDFAIAAVPGRASPEAAAAALPHLAPHTLYIDVSTAAPDDLRASAAAFAERERDFVDTAILGAIAITGGATPVLIAGRQSGRAASVFEAMGAPAKVLEGGQPGDAVALKLLRSVIIKGIECLAIESLTAAEQLGVRDKLFAALGDVDAAPFQDLLSSLVTTHLRHAERRMHEMEEAVSQLSALGFDAAVVGALGKRYRATLAARETNPPPVDAHESLDEALSWLAQTCRKPAKG